MYKYFNQTCTIYNQTHLIYFQVDSWVDFSVTLLTDTKKFQSALAHLDKQLSPVTYLVGQTITLADFAVWGALKGTYSIMQERHSEGVQIVRQCSITLQ